MNGYHRAPDATAAAIDADGWYHTGDLASMDDRGYLRIEGRVKDMIIREARTSTPARSKTSCTPTPVWPKSRSSVSPTRAGVRSSPLSCVRSAAPPLRHPTSFGPIVESGSPRTRPHSTGCSSSLFRSPRRARSKSSNCARASRRPLPEHHQARRRVPVCAATARQTIRDIGRRDDSRHPANLPIAYRSGGSPYWPHRAVHTDLEPHGIGAQSALSGCRHAHADLERSRPSTSTGRHPFGGWSVGRGPRPRPRGHPPIRAARQ